MSKSIAIRLEEMREVYSQLNKMGIDENRCYGIGEFKKLVNKFISGGESVSGSIYIEELDRDLDYKLETSEKPSIVVFRMKKSDYA
jgi:hypothetical protein